MPTCSWYERRKGIIVLCVLFLNHLSRLEGLPALSPARAYRGDLVQVRETIAAETYCKTARALLALQKIMQELLQTLVRTAFPPTKSFMQRRRASRRNSRFHLQVSMHPLWLCPPIACTASRAAGQKGGACAAPEHKADRESQELTDEKARVPAAARGSQSVSQTAGVLKEKKAEEPYCRIGGRGYARIIPTAPLQG